MFSAYAKQAEQEKNHVFNLFKLLRENGQVCFISKAALAKQSISLPMIMNVLNRLEVVFEETNVNFIIYLTKTALSSRLDEEYSTVASNATSKMRVGEAKLSLDETTPNSKKRTASSAEVEAPNDRKTRAPVQEPAALKMAASSTKTPASPRNETLTECLEILDSTRSAVPADKTKPYYATAAQRAMLERYLEIAVGGLAEIEAHQTKAQYDTLVRQANAQRNSIKQEFTTQFSTEVLCDELGEPVIFSCLQPPLKAKEDQTKINRITRVFNYPEDQLQTLKTNKIRLQQLFTKAQHAAQIIDTTADVLGYFCTRGGLPNDAVRVLTETHLPAVSSGETDPLTHLTVTIVGANEAIGYSIHNILVIAEVIPSAPYVGNPSQRFEAPSSFTLNYQQIKKLQEYLSDLSVWYRDFENILSSLFDEDAAPYVKTGCKPLREAVKTEIVRERTQASQFMTREVRERFNSHPTELFLLFGQAAIDLTAHPHREAMRELLQRFYDANTLKDSKNERKTFILDEHNNLTFTSLLSIGHIRKIYNEVMAFSTLTKSAKEIGFSLFDYIELVGAGKPEDLYHNYLQLLMIDIAMTVVPSTASENQTQKRRRVEVMVRDAMPAPRESTSLYQMYQNFQKNIETILTQNTDIRRLPITSRADLEPTQAEKIRLLEPVASQHPTHDLTREFKIGSSTTLTNVIEHLKACRAYQVASESYMQHFLSTGAQHILPGQRYLPDTIYMHPSLDECIRSLEAEFNRRQSSAELILAKEAFLGIVLKMVYAHKMNIPDTAITRVGVRFADIFKIDDARADLNQGCNTGLAGRILTIESQLIAAEEVPFIQFNKQLLIDEAEISFNNTLGSSRYGESSMSARYKPFVNLALGLQPSGVTAQISSLTREQRSISACLQDLASRYTPGYIYQKCYEYMCDHFRQYIREDDNEAMENLLRSLGYTEFSQFKIAEKWNIKRFEVYLPQRLIELLFSCQILQPGTGNLVIDITPRQTFSFAATTRAQAASISRDGFFTQPERTAEAIQPQANQGWDDGLYEESTDSRTTAEATPSSVDLRGESKQSTAPGTGSVG